MIYEFTKQWPPFRQIQRAMKARLIKPALVADHLVVRTATRRGQSVSTNIDDGREVFEEDKDRDDGLDRLGEVCGTCR